MNLNKKLNESLDSLDTFTLTESENRYEVTYDDGAVQRMRTPIQTDVVTGNRNDLMEFLDSIYVEVDSDDDDNLESFESWIKHYEDDFDPSGSTVVLSIKENGNEIYRNSDYDYYMENNDDDSDDYDDEDYEY